MSATLSLCARWSVLTLFAAGLAMLVSAPEKPAQAQEIPSYTVDYIGPGFPKAVNSAGLAVGWRIESGLSRAWVGDASGQLLLPLPAEFLQSRANDVNDSGEIVGSVWTDILDEPGRAVLWGPAPGGGYDVMVLETEPGDRKSEAKAINNHGDIAGNRLLANGSGRAFRIVGGIFEALDDFGALTEDINDGGDIIGGGMHYDGVDGTVTDLGVPPRTDTGQSFNFSFFYALNEGEQSGGFARVATSTDDTRRAVRRSAGSTEPLWDLISLIGQFDAAYGINEGGDVVFEASFLCDGSIKPMVFFDHSPQESTRHCLQDLLSDPNWTMSNANFDADINDLRQIVTVAFNSVTGQTGAILLTPGEVVTLPEMPQNLAAATHAAAPGENWNGIRVTWADTSNESSYRLQRSLDGGATWADIATPPMDVTAYDDETGATGLTYHYQLFAVNALGDSSPSDTASATAPSLGGDSEPPSISIDSPVDNEEVSGNVKVRMIATDNIAVSQVELFVDGSLICRVNDPADDTIVCNWNTRKDTPGEYLLEAFARDAAGWEGTDQVLVTLVEKTRGGGPKGPGNK